MFDRMFGRFAWALRPLLKKNKQQNVTRIDTFRIAYLVEIAIIPKKSSCFGHVVMRVKAILSEKK